MDEFETFVIENAELRIPKASLTDRLRKRLQTGGYERHERSLARRLIVPGDRVLDLGAGAGLVSIVASRIVGPGNVVSVEANPEMLPALRHNLRQQIAQGLRLIEAAVVSDDMAEDHVTMNLRGAFWAASVDPGAAGKPRRVTVPALKFGTLLDESAATVLTVDVEGTEAQLLARPLPERVRLVIVELHPANYGQEVRNGIIAKMAARGFQNQAARAAETEVFAFKRVSE